MSVSDIEKAYGGCHKCYGKGYATWRHGETYRGATHDMRNDIKYCTCERGKQLEGLIANKETVAENIKLVAKADIPAEWTDPVTGAKLYNEASLANKETAALERLRLAIRGEDPDQYLPNDLIALGEVEECIDNTIEALAPKEKNNA